MQTADHKLDFNKSVEAQREKKTAIFSKMEDCLLQLIYKTRCKHNKPAKPNKDSVRVLANRRFQLFPPVADFNSGTNSACIVLLCQVLCPDQVVLLPTDSPADHAARHPGPDAAQAHPRGRRGHFVLQVQAVLQRHTREVHIHR